MIDLTIYQAFHILFQFYCISLYTYVTMIQPVPTYRCYISIVPNDDYQSYMFCTDMWRFPDLHLFGYFRFINDSSMFCLSTMHQRCLYTFHRIRDAVWLISVYLRLFFITICYFFINCKFNYPKKIYKCR